MNDNQRILFALMDDLPHDPFKARVVAWQRLELREMADSMVGADILSHGIKSCTVGDHAPGAENAEPLVEALASIAASACDCPSPPKNVPESNRFAPSRVATRRSATF